MKTMSMKTKGTMSIKTLLRFAAVTTIALTLAACATNTDDAEGPETPPAQGGITDGPNRVQPVDGELDGVKIALLSFGNNPFWEPVEAGAVAAAEKLADRGATVDYIVMGATLDVPTIITAIESAVTQGYDAIGVVPLADGACPAIEAAVNQGVPVATFIAEGTCSEDAGSLFFHGQDGFSAGEIAGATMAEQIGCTGTVGVITGSFGVQIHEDRRLGFETALAEACPDVVIAPAVENADDAGRAQSISSDFMTAYPDLAGIYVTAGGPFGAAQAVEQAGKAGKVKVISFDFVPETVDLVRAGVISATIGQDPFGEGYNTAILLFNYLVDGVAPDIYFIPVVSEVLTAENADEILRNQGN
jgi:ribose transport system substrate-binding protein